MGKHYRHLGLEERCQVAELHKAGRSIQQIAAALDCSPSSISRELKRNRGVQVGYKPTYAQEQAAARRWKGSRLERNVELRELVLDRLRCGWSPEQIAGWLTRSKAATRISHESIYRFIYDQIRRTNDGSWRHYLPRAKSKRGRRPRASRSPVSLIKGRVSIALRPPESACVAPSAIGRPTSCCSPPPATPSWCRKNASPEPCYLPSSPARRPPGCRTPAQLVHRDRSATAQVHHLRQRHRVRPASPPGRSARRPNLLLRSPQPLAEGTIENAIGRLRRFLPRSTNISHRRRRRSSTPVSPPTTTRREMP